MFVFIKRLPLKKLSNTRDLGGLPTTDGRKIKSGKLIRSGKLYKLPQKTIDALIAYGVTSVVDLRIFTEVEEDPDTLWDGVKYTHLPVLCTATPGITQEKTMHRTMEKESRRIKEEFGTADNYMIAMYRAVLMNEEPKKQLTKALRMIIENDGCILWHCAGGKDRAGILSMLVESLLGVDEKVIIADYVASSRFQRAKYFWSRFGLIVVPLRLSFKRILFALMAAKSKYLTVVMEDIKQKYGSVTQYCKEELGITDEDIELMKSKYLD